MVSVDKQYLRDNRLHFIGNFNFNLTLNIASIQYSFMQAAEILPKMACLNSITYASRNLFTVRAWYCDVLWCGIFLRPTAARLSKCPPFFGMVILMTFVCEVKTVSLLSGILLVPLWALHIRQEITWNNTMCINLAVQTELDAGSIESFHHFIQLISKTFLIPHCHLT